ncbi:MAG: YjbH domain-containing protein [Bacteroidales bacterium]|nr:YjbH domain-containing protein [Bacteroidales bacterium]
MRLLHKHLFTVLVLALFLNGFESRGQFMDGASGLLLMPSAEMNQSGTLMITNNFMNAHTLPSDTWGYNSFGYGFDITLWQRLEVYYTCILLVGKRKPNPTERDLIMFNQDRHLGVKMLLLKGGDFGVEWLPKLAVGINDFDKGMFTARGQGNGFFTRFYAVASESFLTVTGPVGAHLGYQFNNWTYYSLSGPIAAIDWEPVWLQNEDLISTKLIVEYDARTLNIGVVASIWQDRFEAMMELQAFRWFSAGIRYKLVLR